MLLLLLAAGCSGTPAEGTAPDALAADPGAFDDVVAADPARADTAAVDLAGLDAGTADTVRADGVATDTGVAADVLTPADPGLRDTPAETAADTGGDAASEVATVCPDANPVGLGLACTEGLTCQYDQDCCCGSCHPRVVCDCKGARLGCYDVGACADPVCGDAVAGDGTAAEGAPDGLGGDLPAAADCGSGECVQGS
jgi:hypothetical protein